MASNGENKKMSLNWIAIIVSTVVGLAIGIALSIRTGNPSIFVILGIFAFVEAILIKNILELEVRKLANRFADEMQKIKEGDFSVMITPKEYGILGPVASTVNTVLSDIRNLIDGFFN